MSRRTIAAALELSESAFTDLVNRGVVPQGVKIGGAVRWRWEDVDAALQAKQTECFEIKTVFDFGALRRGREEKRQSTLAERHPRRED